MTPACLAVKPAAVETAPSFEDRLKVARAWIEARGRGWMVVGYQREGFYYDGRGLPGWRFKRWEDVGGDL